MFPRWLPNLRPFPILPSPSPPPSTPFPHHNAKRQVIPTNWGHFLYPSSSSPPEHWRVGDTVTIRMQTKLSTYTVGLWQNATLIRILTVHSASAGSSTEQIKETSFDWVVARSEPNVSAAVVGGGGGGGLVYRLKTTHGSNPENQSRDWAQGFESVGFSIREADNSTTTPTKGNPAGTSRGGAGGLTTGLPTTTSVVRTETTTLTAGIPPTSTFVPPLPPLTVIETPSSSKAGRIGGGVAGGLMFAAVIGALLWFLKRRRREGSQRGIKRHDISAPVLQMTSLYPEDSLGGRSLSPLQLDLKRVVFEADGTPEMRIGDTLWGTAGGVGGAGDSGEWMFSDERGRGPVELGSP